MNQGNNPVEQLIEIGKQNQVLLSKIEVNQQILVEMERGRKEVESRKLYFIIGKYAFWVVMMFISFMFTQNLVKGLTSNLMGGLGGGGGQNVDIGNLLKNSDVESLLKSLQ